MKRLMRFFLKIMMICLASMVMNVSAKNEIKIVDKKVHDGVHYSFVEGIQGVFVSRGENAYEGEISIPASVEFNGVSYQVRGVFSNAFCCSPLLKKVDIKCPIKEISDFQFYNCYNLSEVILPDGLKCIHRHAFEHCHKLENIQIPESLKTIACHAFDSCYVLKNISLPHTLDYIGTSAFTDCYNLREICLPDTLKIIKEECFSGCVCLEKVTFGKNIETISEKAFFNCNNLNSPILPESLVHVQDKAFYNCYLISDLVFPMNVQSIGWCAFANCNGLRSLSFAGETPPKFSETPFYYNKRLETKNIDVNVPDGFENKYKWALFLKLRRRVVNLQSFTAANNSILSINN